MVTDTYKVAERFPKSEVFGLASQLKRAIISVPSNIAEGQGRRLKGEFLQFLGNARGSLLELDTHLEIALRLGFIGQESHATLADQLIEIRKLLNGLIRSISRS